MHRAFLSLYMLIVASVVLVGLGFDALVRFYAPEQIASQSDHDLMRLAAHYSTSAQPAAGLARYQLADFASTQMAERLRAGELVVVHAAPNERQLYQQQADGSVLMFRQPLAQARRSPLYNWLLVVFYAVIAVAVFFWVWPLSRDLRKLERQTRLVGQDHLSAPLSIHQASPVYDLAASFSRMSERVKALLASHQEMTSAVSHELRTPLARMKFALAMVQADAEPAKLQQHVQSMQADVAEMDTLVNELLAYAGFEHRSQSLQQQAGDLAYLITQLIERIKTAPPGAQLVFDFANRLDGQPVTCEWHLLERALHNLLQNAARFAVSRVQITLQTYPGGFEVLVEDDGPGVAVNDRERIFQSFVRLATSANATTRGFGLGLAIVRRVATWHGGGAEVSGSGLGGAKFRLWWPRQSLPALGSNQPSSPRQ